MIVYSRSSGHRRDQFRLVTTIEKNAQGMLVRKRPLTPQAKAHIMSILDHYEKLSRRDLPFDLPKPTKDGNSVTIPYLPSQNLAAKFTNLILRRKFEAASKLLDTFLDMLHQIPQKEFNLSGNQAFIKVFGKEYATQNQLCFNGGFVDFNLDNFMVDDHGNYTLIDYEWEFEFPMPVDLVVGRLLFWAFNSLSSSFKLLGSEAEPVVSIGDHLFMTKTFYKRYKVHFQDMEKILAAEACFQHYVTFTSAPPSNSDKINTTVVEHTKPLFPGVVQELEESQRELTFMNDRYKIVSEQLAAAQKELAAGEVLKRLMHTDSLQSIVETRSWKAYSYAHRGIGKAKRAARKLKPSK